MEVREKDKPGGKDTQEGGKEVDTTLDSQQGRGSRLQRNCRRTRRQIISTNPEDDAQEDGEQQYHEENNSS